MSKSSKYVPMESQGVVAYNTFNTYHPTLRDARRNLTPCTTEFAKTKTLFIVSRLTMDMIKVSANSRTAAVAGAIAGIVREHHRAEVQPIGAGAVNQAIKALILA